MRKAISGILAAFAAALITSAASAAPLSEQDRALVGAAIGSVEVIDRCRPEYKATGSSLRSTLTKIGDRIGADTDRILLAIDAAVFAWLGKDHDRKDVIPEVSRLGMESFKKVANESRQNKAKFCKRWGDMFVDMRILQRE